MCGLIRVLVLTVLILPITVVAFVTPSHDGRVTDLADIFSDTQEVELEAQLQSIENLHHAEIAIVTLPSLEGNDIQPVATQIAQDRGVGKEQVDNGILIAIAPEERQRRIEVGYGLEGELPDVTASRLGRNILVPAFQAGDYFGGMTALVDALSGVVAGSYDLSGLEEREEEETLLEKLFIGAMMIVFLSFFLSMFTKGIAESNKKKLTKKQKSNISSVGSLGTTLLGVLMIGGWGIVYVLPAYLVWRMIMESEMKMDTSGGNSGGWGGGWPSGGSFGGGFGGFGGGSFGGGGAGGRW